MTVRRLKTYASSEGYVYQYYFVGKQPVQGNANETEYIFDVSSDRKQTYPVSILMPADVTLGWTKAHLRPLSDSEQYAAVKLRLFRAFDEEPALQAGTRRFWLDAQFLDESLASLGIE